MSLISLEGVKKSYRLGDVDVPALRGLDLQIEAGDFLIIRGPSGCGKTTLLNILALIDTAGEGQYSFAGKDVGKLSDRALTDLRRKEIGIIFQSFNLVPVLSAVENVALPLEIGGMRHAAARARAMELLDEVEIGHLAANRPDQLSGGQRQRVAIARSLVAKPRLIIADEPTANLDSATAGRIVDLLDQLNRQHGVTLLLSTHDNSLNAKASREIRLGDGRIVSNAQPLAA